MKAPFYFGNNKSDPGVNTLFSFKTIAEWLSLVKHFLYYKDELL